MIVNVINLIKNLSKFLLIIILIELIICFKGKIFHLLILIKNIHLTIFHSLIKVII